jgi:hypothetical protein
VARPAWHARLRRDGFVLLPGLPRPMVDRLRALLDRVARRTPTPAERRRWVMESDLPAAKRGGVALPPGRDAVFILGEPGRLSPLFLVAAAWPPVVAAVAGALGSRALCFHFANVTLKTARFGSGIGWHRDAANRYIATRGGHFLRALICLDPMDSGNGGTTFRPGSHRKGGKAGRAPVVPRCRPGGVLLVDPLTLHGGGPNDSGRPRRLLVVQWGRRDDPSRGPEREPRTGQSPRALRAAVQAG